MTLIKANSLEYNTVILMNASVELKNKIKKKHTKILKILNKKKNLKKLTKIHSKLYKKYF